MLLVDSVFLVSILLASFSIRLGYWYLPHSDLIWAIFGAPVIAIPIFVRFGLYRSVIRYIGFKALWAVVQAVSLYALVWGVVGFMAAVDGIPRSVILINWVLSLLAIGGVRILARTLLSGNANFKFNSKSESAKRSDKKTGTGLWRGESLGSRRPASTSTSHKAASSRLPQWLDGFSG